MYRGESVLIVSEDVTARQAILEALHLHTHRLRSFVTDSVATGIAYLDACHVSTVVLEVPLRYASAFRVLIDVGQRKPSIPVVALVDGLRPQEGAREKSTAHVWGESPAHAARVVEPAQAIEPPSLALRRLCGTTATR